MPPDEQVSYKISKRRMIRWTLPERVFLNSVTDVVP